jgi:predicted DNA-binding antitoxin AbrB/MazE fold protein
MTITVNATYEAGVLKPAHPLPLEEHAQVRVTLEARVGAKQLSIQPAVEEPPLWEQILALTRDLPPEEFEGLPTDGASQHDHYIYGTPKRTDLPQPE